jgi:hypothetical protein
LICLVLLYGSETWVLTKRKENRSLVFERNIFRTDVDGVYKSKYNLELDMEFNSPNVIGVEKINRLRYAGHMRGAEDLLQRNLIRIVPERRWNQGRPKSR